MYICIVQNKYVLLKYKPSTCSYIFPLNKRKVLIFYRTFLNKEYVYILNKRIRYKIIILYPIFLHKKYIYENMYVTLYIYFIYKII